ncbi:hypothetical protein Rleg5DRAFT_5330 [Rhizobium leguminosarum bv. viciae WSM1455]|nr:hypothetical protein Rleg5DRAFT_5330 [Rhizobium leguminosarum bv. viciae WSM1455]
MDAKAYKEAARHIDRGQEFRYDREADETPRDWAPAAARGILHDRRDIKHILDEIDPDIRVEIVEALSCHALRASHQSIAVN